jgi:hypothetical protein
MTKSEIIQAWNEVEEVVCDFRTFTDKELIDNKQDMSDRLEKARDILGSHFTQEDAIEELNL